MVGLPPAAQGYGSLPFPKALFPLRNDVVGAVVPPFFKGGLGGISETAAQANVAKSDEAPTLRYPSFPLLERGEQVRGKTAASTK